MSAKHRQRQCKWDACTADALSRHLCARHYNAASHRGCLDEFPRLIGEALHRLTSIDRSARTAHCAECGPGARIYIRRSDQKATCAGSAKPKSDQARLYDNAQAKAKYWANIELSRENSRNKVDQVRAIRIAQINEIKLSRGCADCGYNAHPAALSFDHIDPRTKLFGIAKGLTYSWEKILAEIAKCEVRCANCHMVRSVKEGHLGRPRIDRVIESV